ncbi:MULTISPECIES: hypothetical protein [unclassified Psychrobacter]|uniref:hypothetical protein n=1 Tax=unclassified Psychrobacter TaxID=196806 RepID=UPI0013A66006|nr:MULTISPECIES: hypothetical protein [unclassified Psychrobacter]
MSNTQQGATPLNGDAIEEALEERQTPDSLAEATTAEEDSQALGRHATEADAKK